MALSLLVLAFMVLSGCATRGTVQDNPSANQKIVFASAYSVEGCQTEMNGLAGKEVHMVSDSERVVTSILSFGIVPAHQCVGIAKEGTAVPSDPARHE